MAKKKKVMKHRQQDPYFPCYRVLKGRELRIFTDAGGALNSIRGIEDAICYEFTCFRSAYNSVMTNDLKYGTLVTEQDLIAILEQLPSRVSLPPMPPPKPDRYYPY